MKSLFAFFLLLTLSLPTLSSPICPWLKPADLLVSDMSDLRGELRELSTSEIKEDLACLDLALRYGYTGTEIYASVGIDVLQRISNLSESIQGPLNQEELIKKLFQAHEGMMDMHMYYAFTNQTNHETQKLRFEHKKVYYLPNSSLKKGDHYLTPRGMKKIKLKSCERLKPVRQYCSKGKQTFRFAGQLSEKENTKLEICTTSSGKKLKFHLKQYKEYSLGEDEKLSYKFLEDILYIRIPSFIFSAEEHEMQKEILEVVAKLPPKTPVIVDLRNGNGGVPDFGFALSKALIAKNQSINSSTAFIKTSLMGAGGLSNLLYLFWQTEEDPERKEFLKTYYEEHLAIFQNYVDDGWGLTDLEVNRLPYPTGKGLKDPGEVGPIAILTSKGCGSSCEGIPMVLRGKRDVKIFGTNTGGYVAFGSPALVVLPNSKINFAGGYFGLSAATEVEGTGVPADYFVPKFKKTLKIALKWISSKKEK